MTDLALPDPQQATLAQIPEIIQRSQLIRAHCEKTADLTGAQELKRQLQAFTKYISDREARRELEGETRLVEVLIGKLLGHAEMGRNQYSEGSHDENPPDPGLGQVLDASGIDKSDRMRFRELAANEDLVQQLVADGVTERAKILRQISGDSKPTNGSAPLQDGEFRCPHCKRPVTLESLLTV